MDSGQKTDQKIIAQWSCPGDQVILIGSKVSQVGNMPSRDGTSHLSRNENLKLAKNLQIPKTLLPENKLENESNYAAYYFLRRISVVPTLSIT